MKRRILALLTAVSLTAALTPAALAAEDEGGDSQEATVTTNAEFLAAAQDTGVTKIIVAGDITVDADPVDGAALAAVETAAEIEITGDCAFSIAADTCLVSTAGVGQFHYTEIPAQGNENYDRLAGDGVFFLLKLTDDGGYYRELYGSAEAAAGALTSAEDWFVAVLPACDLTISDGETLRLQGLYLGTGAVLTLERGAGLECGSVMEPTDGGAPGQLRVTALDQLEAASNMEGLS